MPNGSASSNIDIETSLIPEETSFISITGPIIKLLSAPSSFKQVIYGVNFVSSSKCEILSSDESLARIKPRIFSLNSIKNKQVIKLTVSRTTIKKLLAEPGASKVFDMDVICENGTSDKKTLGLFAYHDIVELLEDFRRQASGCRVCVDIKQGK